jgi:hypothetical protein
MESNTVLGKIMTLLSLKDNEVSLTFAKLADGTILESPTFDVGESVEVVSEDGTKSAAPDGEHELELTGAEGEVVRFKIFTKGGVITERENVELEDKDEEKDMSEETIEVDPNITQALEKEEEELIDIEEPAEEADLEEGEDVDETINLEDVAEKVEQMAYRIDELEKKLEAAEETKEEELEEEEEKAVEAKKLDGAPIEASKFSKAKNKKLTPNYHDSVLSRMYNN